MDTGVLLNFTHMWNQKGHPRLCGDRHVIINPTEALSLQQGSIQVGTNEHECEVKPRQLR